MAGCEPAAERRSIMQQATSIAELIRLLRHLGARPGLYICPVDVQNAQSFLGGVSFCVQVLTGPFSPEELGAAVVSRGWRVSSRPVAPPEQWLESQMRQRGMSDAEIIAELAEIDAITLQRRAGPAA